MERDDTHISSKTACADNPGVDRHCAFCLIPIPAKQVKCCAKCHRRAYCSRQCQTNDWKPKNSEDGGIQGVGQGHKSWCGIPYGEEDLDWIVAPIKGKGLGLVAKLFIPNKTRIVVDGFRSDIHFTDNMSLTDNTKASRSLGRSSMANHACDANASRMPDPDFKTMIIYTKREIQPGEEICVNYTKYNEAYDPVSNIYEEGKVLESFQDCRNILKSKWKITCPLNCFCRNEEMDKLIIGGRTVNAYLKHYADTILTRTDADLCLAAVKRLLDDHHQQIHGSWVQMTDILEIGFRVAVQQKQTLDMASEFIKESYDIWSSILHPRGSIAIKDEKLMQDLATSENYLILEV